MDFLFLLMNKDSLCITNDVQVYLLRHTSEVSVVGAKRESAWHKVIQVDAWGIKGKWLGVWTSWDWAVAAISLISDRVKGSTLTPVFCPWHTHCLIAKDYGTVGRARALAHSSIGPVGSNLNIP